MAYRLDEFASLRMGFLDLVANLDGQALAILLAELEVPEHRRSRARELLGERLGSSQLAALVGAIVDTLPQGEAEPFKRIVDRLRRVQARRNRLAHDHHDFDGSSEAVVGDGLARSTSTTLAALRRELELNSQLVDLLDQILVTLASRRPG